MKAQASIEFAVAFVIVALLFLFFSVIIYQRSVQINETKLNFAGQKISNSIADAINSVFISNSGTSECFSIPEKIHKDSYIVKFYKEEPTVFVYTDRQTWSSPIMTPYVNCTMKICSFSENSTIINVNSTLNIRVSHINDVIYLSEC
ncbi:MAG: hypothetical protein QXY62_01180 [Candidatus Altiarchaeota archaeon]